MKKLYRYRNHKPEVTFTLEHTIASTGQQVFLSNKGIVYVRQQGGRCVSADEDMSAFDIIPCKEKVTVYVYRNKNTGALFAESFKFGFLNCELVRTTEIEVDV